MSENEVLAKHHNSTGNSYSRNRRWELAIDAYSQAITLCPQIPCYWMNRALCYYKCKNWVSVEEDCKRAIQLDSSIVKARHMLGVALLQRGKYSEGIRELEAALDLTRAPNSIVAKRIQCELVRGKYSNWAIAAREKSWKLDNLREACVSALKEKNSQVEGFFMDEVEAASSQQLEALEDVFLKAAEADKPTDVPDYLCCAITLGILQDPVITPYGHTYDKEAIIRHLEQNNFDPITRRPLDRSQLVPNWAVKKAVQAFLDKHGWAYKEFIGDGEL